MSAAEFSPEAIPHSCTLQRVQSVSWAPRAQLCKPTAGSSSVPVRLGTWGPAAVCTRAHACPYHADTQGLAMMPAPVSGAPWAGIGTSGAQPPFAALLASQVNRVLMLSPHSAEGAATLDPINKYTFHTSLKPVIPLWTEEPARDFVLIRGMLRAALPSACPASAARGGGCLQCSQPSLPQQQPHGPAGAGGGGLGVPTTTPLLLRGSQRDQRPQPWPGSHRPLALAHLLPACDNVPGGCALSRQRGFIFKQLAEILPAPPAKRARRLCSGDAGSAGAVLPAVRRSVPTAMPRVERAERLTGTL